MYFDEIALKWDTERRIERAKQLSVSIFNVLAHTKKLSALEIGYGTTSLVLIWMKKMDDFIRKKRISVAITGLTEWSCNGHSKG